MYLAAEMSGQVLLRKDKDIDSHMRNTVTEHIKLYTAFVEDQRAAPGHLYDTIVTGEGLRITTATIGMVLLILLVVNVVHIISKKATSTRY